MILPTGRTATVLAGATVFLVVSVAFFLVFDLSTALGSSSELPIVRIGQEVAQSQSAQVQPTTATTTVAAITAATAVSVAHSSGASAAPSSGSGGHKTNATTDTTTRQIVQEKVRVQGHKSTTTTTAHGSDHGNSGSHRSNPGGR
jgi:hypothetical protein